MLTCQRIVSLMVFLSFVILALLRINISIAILEMVVSNNSNQTDINYGPRYKWNQEQKNNIFGFFYLGYLITQNPGGRLSEKYGTKIVLGVGFLAASILTFFIPMAAEYGYWWIVSARFLLGVFAGVHWPSIAPLCTHWISSKNTSKFISNMAASSLGTALGLPFSGYLISHFGWSSAFYVPGSIGLLWVLTWFYVIYDTPQKHPRISNGEREKLRKEITVALSDKKCSVPWRKIFTSGPVWAIIMGNTCNCFTVFFVINQLPTYMKQILHFNIEQNGWISCLPFCARYCGSILISTIADKLIKTRTCSVTTIRKSAAVGCFLGMACCFLLQALWGCNRVVSVIMFTSAVAMMSLVFVGVYSNVVDIAPNYSGTIMGISQVPGGLSGYLGSKLVGVITKDKQSFEQWTYVFWFIVGINLFTAIFAFIFVSGDQQKWNKKKEDHELDRLGAPTLVNST